MNKDKLTGYIICFPLIMAFFLYLYGLSKIKDFKGRIVGFILATLWIFGFSTIGRIAGGIEKDIIIFVNNTWLISNSVLFFYAWVKR